jgi:hypothetical protein
MLIGSIFSIFALLVFIVMVGVDGTVSAKSAAFFLVLAIPVLACVPPVIICGKILLNRRYGINGLSIHGNTLSTPGRSTRKVMEFNSVSTDFYKQFLLLSTGAKSSSNWFIFPFLTGMFHPAAGRICIPIFLVENDQELLSWISAHVTH